MKKIIVLMTSLLLLTGCVKVSFTGPKKRRKDQTSQPAVKKNRSHLSEPTSIKTRTTKSWKRLRNLSRNIQRLENLENYLSFSQAIPLEMRKAASPCSLL